MLLSLWIYFNFGCYILGCLIWCWLPWLQLRTACFTIKFKTCKVDSLIRNVGAGTYANWSQQCLEKEGTNSQMNLVFDFRLKSCVIGSGSGQSSPKAINRPTKSSLVKGDLGIMSYFIFLLFYEAFLYDVFMLVSNCLKQSWTWYSNHWSSVWAYNSGCRSIYRKQSTTYNIQFLC